MAHGGDAGRRTTAATAEKSRKVVGLTRARRSIHHHDTGFDRRLLVELRDALVEQRDTSGWQATAANACRRVGAVHAIVAAEIERARAERTVGGIAAEQVAQWPQGRTASAGPFLLARDAIEAGGCRAFRTDTDAVAQRHHVRQHDVDKVLRL